MRHFCLKSNQKKSLKSVLREPYGFNVGWIGRASVGCANLFMEPKTIQRYVSPNEDIPFDKWFDALRDRKAKFKITARLERLELGNMGDCRSVGDGVYELRIHYGPGYRVYFGQVGSAIILLLCGGDKSSQAKDIRQAKDYWKDYAKRSDTN